MTPALFCLMTLAAMASPQDPQSIQRMEEWIAGNLVSPPTQEMLLTSGSISGVGAHKDTDQQTSEAVAALANQEIFSFEYDGKPSTGFLGNWKRSHTVEGAETSEPRHTAKFSDPATGLEATLTGIHYRDDAALELLLEFENKGSADTPILSLARTLDALLETETPSVLHHALGDKNSAESFMPIATPVDAANPGPFKFNPGGGRSSNDHMPYFNLQSGNRGTILAIGWAGEWQATFQHEKPGRVNIDIGLRHLGVKLHPGEKIRLPRVLMQFWQGEDPLRGNNCFRAWMIHHSLPRRNGELVMPPICGTTAATDPDGTYEGPHIRTMKPLAERHIEVFWSDMDPQQWYPIGFPEGTGTWDADPAKYPNGMAPIGKAAHDAGLGYLLWFEPERVANNTRIQKEHPEWITEGKPFHLYKLHIPEARAWLTEYIDKTISETNLDWVRWDFNIEPLSYWLRNDAPNRVGMTEIRYIEGLYAMWEELFRRHPGLVVDVCASGGRRLDYETLRYGLPLWHSDLQCFGVNSEADQVQNGALFRWIPLHGCGNQALEPSYAFRSAMTNGNIIGPANSEIGNPAVDEAVKKTVALYKRLRPLMLGDFYPLMPQDASKQAWYGYQFHRSDLKSGFAMLFRRPEAPDASPSLTLKGLDAGSKYAVSYQDKPEKAVITGEELMKFTIKIDAAPGSEIIYYQAQ